MNAYNQLVNTCIFSTIEHFQSVLSDVSTLTSDGDWSHEERLILESHLVAATQGPLCLDPSPAASFASTRIRQSKALITDHQLMRQAKKFSQVGRNPFSIFFATKFFSTN